MCDLGVLDVNGATWGAEGAECVYEYAADDHGAGASTEQRERREDAL